MNPVGRLIGLFGDPVEHSLSPRMHDAALRALGAGHRYLAFRVAPERLGHAVAAARELGMLGFNVTVPHKQAIAAWLDELAPCARRVGAVNTVVEEGGRLVGYNTDATGLFDVLASLGWVATARGPWAPWRVRADRIRPAAGPLRRALVLGAGGASRAVVAALCDGFDGLEVTWVSRAPGRHGDLAAGRVAEIDWSRLDPEGAWDLLINTTTVGMAGGPADFGFPLPVAQALAVVDLAYGTRPTELVGHARRLGKAALDGRALLLWQGVGALERWLNEPLAPATIDEMASALVG